ncbi:transposase InsO family protein [Salsuginibacillus halophilus]|uniref:Transposase InsO family protein n=2 Tax=Salsuginibacillus halophilus TaxID=517424 RepID=A0A2P8HFS0_9BACI|nr:transposase InsO family protein [Salsuginibacillus halophilus]
MCHVLGVSRSGYYAYVARISREETEREAFNRHLDQLILRHFHTNYGCYGSPRIWRLLREKDGLKVSERKVTQRMGELGLYAVQKKKYVVTTDSDHDEKVFENHLNRSFLPDFPNTTWATDITYTFTLEGFVYLNPVMDLFSRRIISYRIDDHMEARLSLNALREAIARRRPEEGFVHHSDRGSQYTSNAYVKTLEEAGAVISMGRKGDPYDNACMESFFASLKKEFLHKQTFATKEEAYAAVDFYIRFYNQHRMHSSLNYVSPMEAEMAYTKAHSAYTKTKEAHSVS